MKLVTFFTDRARVGALRGESEIVDLSDRFGSMLDLLDGGDAAMEQARRLLETSNTIHAPGRVRLLAPVPRPRSIRDCLCYERHLTQSMRTVARWRFAPAAALDRLAERVTGRGFLRPPKAWFERPVYYKGNPASVVGPDTGIHWPPFTRKLDFELEVGIFISREGRDIPESEAQSYIAGYTIFNDVSARDTQLSEMGGRLGPAKGKDFDTGNVMGPWLVTPDEVPDPYSLRVSASVNGEQWSSGTTAGPRFTFAQIIAYISRSETLYPGDFIASGTIPDCCGLELNRWIKPGDVVELAVERLGLLRSHVVSHFPTRP